MRFFLATCAVAIALPAAAQPPEASLRPVLRGDAVATKGPVLAAAAGASIKAPVVSPEATTPVSTTGNLGYLRWIEGFRIRAKLVGISKATLDAAFEDPRYDTDVIQRDRNQSEFTKTIWDYLDSAVSPTRVKNGVAALADHQQILRAIERKYGVEKEVVAAIWGLESAYGSFRGSTKIINALATLAYDGRRGAFFEAELIAALKILQNGDVTAAKMTGSWAGAMGHTQFMPTSYLQYAVDFTGDGKRDIWSDDPTDALASTAAYLKGFGWKKGQPWGVEVRLPEGFDYALARRDLLKMPSEWARLGVVAATNGRAVSNHGKASVLVPAGASGAAFLIFDNFEVLERYNTADAYVIGVGHLSDRITGGPAIQAEWPREDRVLTLKERLELQTRLTSAGFDTQKIDGKIGPLTIAAVRDYQKSVGLVPDGYASLRLLRRLR